MRANGPSIGRHWEEFAARYLAKRGMSILERRYRCRFGEIDLIGRQGDEVVLVEIKARAAGSLVSAVESVGHRKQVRILKTAEYYLRRHPEFSEWPVRLDVFAVNGINSNRPEVEWIRNAFDRGAILGAGAGNWRA